MSNAGYRTSDRRTASLIPVTGPAGTNRIEICNDTTGSAVPFYRAFGALEAAHGVAGAAAAFTVRRVAAPQALAVDANRRDSAIELDAQPGGDALPTLTAWGIALPPGLARAGSGGVPARTAANRRYAESRR